MRMQEKVFTSLKNKIKNIKNTNAYVSLARFYSYSFYSAYAFNWAVNHAQFRRKYDQECRLEYRFQMWPATHNIPFGLLTQNHITIFSKEEIEKHTIPTCVIVHSLDPGPLRQEMKTRFPSRGHVEITWTLFLLKCA